MTIRIVVVDDHALFREGLRAILDGRDGIVFAGDHSDAEEAIAAIEAERPDVVLMDLHMPRVDGVAATRRIRAEHPRVRVLVLSMLDDRPSVRAALDAGATGYVTKSSSLEDIIGAIHATARGQLLIGADVAGHARHSDGPDVREAAEFGGLTLRERQLLPMLAEGWPTERMAARLGITEKTVRNYLSALYLKLGVSDRASAALAARAALDGGAMLDARAARDGSGGMPEM